MAISKTKAVKATKLTKTATKPASTTIGMEGRLGEEGVQALQQNAVADKAAARTSAQTDSAKVVQPNSAKGEKAKTVDDRKITLVAEACPSKAGTKRATRWAKIRNEMTVSEAGKLGVPRSFLERMAKAGHIRLA